MNMQKWSRMLAMASVTSLVLGVAASNAEEKTLSTPGTIIHHVTLKWKADASDEDKQKVMDGLKEILADVPGVKNVWLKSLKVQPQDYSQSFVVEFENEAALQAYANHPKKKAWNDLYYIIREASRNNVTTNEGAEMTSVMTSPNPSIYATDLAMDLERVGKKMVALAEAFPEDKYGWQPSEGVRTTSQVFMHVVGTNLLMPPALGSKPLEGLEIPENPFELGAKWEKEVTAKDEVVKKLGTSFEYAVKAMKAIPADEMDKEVEMFGFKAPKKVFVLIILTHAHEHLGQAIAYARSVGVVPPWSQPAPKSE